MDGGSSHKPIISVQTARQILGGAYSKYSDDYIEQLINNLDAVAEAFIKSVPKDDI